MEYSQIFGTPPEDAEVQPVSQPASAANNSAPGTRAAPMLDGGKAVSISWLGLLIAFVAWRVVYEMSE